jgi:hypothetical protein
MPNAGAGGYYRWTISGKSLQALVERGWAKLTVRERMSVAQAIQGAFGAGRLSVDEALSALAPLAAEKDRPVAEAPMGLLQYAISHLAQSEQERAQLRAFGAKLYTPVLRRLGWGQREGEGGENRLLRASVARFLAEVARDPAARKKAALLGLNYLNIKDGKLDITLGAVANDLVQSCVRVAVQDGDRSLFETLTKALPALEDAPQRSTIISALGSVRDDRAAEALEFVLSAALRRNEILTPLWEQVGDPQTRPAAFDWFRKHFDVLEKKLGASGLSDVPWLGWDFCSGEERRSLEDFFKPRLSRIEGGPRTLSLVSEQVTLCAAKANFHRKGLKEFLETKGQH